MAGRDKLTAEGKKFFKMIEELAELEVRIGYEHGDAVDNNGVDIADVAMFNEVGMSRAPARPFMRKSVDNNEDTISKFCQVQAGKIVQGGSAQQVLSSIGSMQVGLIQDTITKSKSWAVPNAPATVKRKKSDTPLVDEGRLLQSPKYVIQKKGG
jgi:hypothetical protein